MFNSFILIILVIFSIILYYAFVLPKKERILFKMYKERDTLTIYAMNNPGKQDEEAYEYLIGLINAEIFLIRNNLSLTDYFKTTIEKSVENEREVERIIGLIREDKVMEEIYENTFRIFSKYFSVKFKWLYRIFLFPLSLILKVIIKAINLVKKGDLSKREQRMNIISSTTLNMPRIYERYVKLNKTI